MRKCGGGFQEDICPSAAEGDTPRSDVEGVGIHPYHLWTPHFISLLAEPEEWLIPS